MALEVDWAELPTPRGQTPELLAAAGLTFRSTAPTLALELPGYSFGWLRWPVP